MSQVAEIWWTSLVNSVQFLEPSLRCKERNTFTKLSCEPHISAVSHVLTQTHQADTYNNDNIFKKIKNWGLNKTLQAILAIVYRFSVSEYICIIHLCMHMYTWYRFEEKFNNNLRIVWIKDWLHFTLPKLTHSYCKSESKGSLWLCCIPLACLCVSNTGMFSKGNCELTLTA